ncbi:MAG TPA: PfkB family carbohydrate kinase [Roseiflexaceae bacterium]|nr:PfkB family carbohydrate kinase [Roseiflexaceae bacterium]
MQVVCVGEVTVDRYLDLGRDFAGGISLNVAVNARRCGAARVGLVSVVGDDAGGALALAKLAREGVEHSRVRTMPGPTARQDIRTLPGGERLFPPGGYHPGVLAGLRLSEEDLAYLRAFDLAVVPVFRQVEGLARAVLEDARFAGHRAADFLDGADLGPDLQGMAAYLPRLDLAFLSGDDTAVERLAPLARAFHGVIVVTLGAHGSVALSGAERAYQPALPGPAPVDTTGAGDAFQAAFALAYFAGGGIQRALACGAERAAQVIRHYGATA